jgi:site-specific recombinase XerD
MKKALTDFLTHLSAERNCSPCTIRAYRTDLTQFLTFLKEQSGAEIVKPALLTPCAIRQYGAWLRKRSCAVSTVARHLAAVRSWCRFLNEVGVLDSFPAASVALPRPDRRLPKLPSRSQMEPRGLPDADAP